MIPTGGFGVSPVEDSGGVMGWEDVCKKLAGRKKSDKNEMIQWIQSQGYKIEADLDHFDKNYCKYKILKNEDP